MKKMAVLLTMAMCMIALNGWYPSATLILNIIGISSLTAKPVPFPAATRRLLLL